MKNKKEDSKRFISMKELFSIVFVFLFLFFGVIGFISYRNFSAVSRQMNQYISESKQINQLTSEINATIGYGGLIHNFKNYVLRRDDKYYDRVVVGYDKFTDLSGQMKTLSSLSDEDKAYLEIIETVIGQYRSMADVVKEMKTSGATVQELDAVVKIDDGPAMEAFKNLQESFSQFSDIEMQKLNSRVLKSNYIIGGLLMLLMLSTLLTLVYIYRAISKELKYFASVSRDMAEGDLTRRVDIRTKDMIGNLSRNFDASISNFAELLTSIKNSADENNRANTELILKVDDSLKESDLVTGNTGHLYNQVNDLMDQISTASSAAEEVQNQVGNFARRSVDQVESVNQTSASIEEINASISNVARITEAKLDQTRKLVEITAKGSEIINESTAVTAEISSRASVMMEMIEVINNVAAQTNLLSMNAAIEAAHAGDYGKGFAVVADEIRKLSQSTAASAGQISGSLKELMAKVEIARKSSESSGQAFLELDTIVEDVSRSFQEIQDSMSELKQGSNEILNATDLLQRISVEVGAGSKEMEVGIKEINRSLLNMKEFGDTTRSAAQEIEGSMKEISTLTTDVSELSETSNNQLQTLRKELDRFVLP